MLPDWASHPHLVVGCSHLPLPHVDRHVGWTWGVWQRPPDSPEGRPAALSHPHLLDPLPFQDPWRVGMEEASGSVQGLRSALASKWCCVTEPSGVTGTFSIRTIRCSSYQPRVPTEHLKCG